MGACLQESAPGGVRKGVIICFVVCLRTRYLYGDEILQRAACKGGHVDGRVWMGACGWEYGDGSYFFLTIYFQEKLFLMTFNFSLARNGKEGSNYLLCGLLIDCIFL